MDHQPERREFRSDDGIPLIAETWGDSSARPVLLQHGGGQTRHAWGNTAIELADAGWYAMSLDLRGHGDSGWDPNEDYSLDAYARDTAAVVRQLGRAPAIVGASLGGMAALRATDLVEGRVLSALILVDVTPTLNRSGAENIVRFMGAKMHEGFASLDEAADTIAEYLPHRKKPSNHDGLRKNLRLHEDGRYRWHWDPAFVKSRRNLSANTENPLLGAAERLREPALLVRGRMSDLVTPETAQEFLDLVPHAKFVDVSGAGHMVAGDKNDIFSAAVVEFLSEVPSDTGMDI